MRRAFAGLMLLLGLPIIGQEPEGPYFALNSNATFAPGEKARIMLSAEGLKKLDFRLYRVENASDFLGQLVDAHSFGSNTTQLPRERTPIERFSRWKRRLRATVQDFARGQFSPTATTAWRARSSPTPTPSAKKTDPNSKGTTYASIPILNEKQLLKSWQENITTKERYAEQPVDLPISQAGLYLVEATDGKKRAYTIVSMSQMALLTKTQPGHAWARVVDRTTGQGLSGIDVEFRSARRSYLKVKTDGEGFAKLDQADNVDVFTIATRGTDVTFDSLSEYALGRQDERRMQSYLYTERPVYRPGHKVFFKAILRQPAEFGYRIFPADEVQAEITDSDGKVALKKSLAVSKFGSVNGEFELPMTASLGYYSIKVQAGEADAYGGFNVEEYKKPEYEVKIKPSKPRVLQGEKVDATIQARYYFGEPVKGAKVKYTVRRARYYPPWYEPEEGAYEQTEEEEGGGEFFRGEQGEEQEGKLNDNGELTISLPTPVVETDYLFRIEARVMDEGNREVTGYGVVMATRANYMVTVRADRYVASPGQNMSFTITTKDYDNNPVSADFRAEFKRWNHDSDYKAISSSSGRTGADGNAKVSFNLSESGSFILDVNSRTAQGRDVKDREWVWVSGAYDTGADEERIKIITDKKKYAPGDTAKLLLMSPEANLDAWLSIEYRGIVESRPLKAKEAGGIAFEVPIKSDYQPNVTVSVTYVKRGRLFKGEARLRVPPVEKEIQLTVTPSKQEFKPGEPARFEVLAKDYKGQPVAAEVSVGVVDEALYAIQRETLQTPLSAFYGGVYSEVQESSSLSYYFRGEAGTRAMRLAKIRPSLGQLKPERVGDPRVRKAFPDTAFWTPDLITDASGKGTVEFAFPDALTMWRTTARAFTVDTKVGHVLNRVTVRKNLMLRSVNPRFLMEGDEVNIGAIVQNYLTSAKQAKVSIQATNVEFLDATERSVNVESKGTQKTEFRVRVKPGVESVITLKAITDEESDAMEITLPIKPYGTLLSNGASGALTGGQSAKATLRAPGGNRSVELSVSPSLAGSLFGALEYLTQFPYGCTEQTMSSFLPNVTVTKVLNELGVKSNVRRDDLTKKVNAGLARLYDYQHEDGAWGWWKNDDSHPFMTAHVVAGLKEAKAAGYPVSEEVLQKSERWLRAEFKRQSDAVSDLRAYIAYSLGTKEDVEAVWSSRSKMTTYGLAFLGLALEHLKDPRAMEIAQSLESAAKQNDSEAWWPGERDPLLDFPMDTTPEISSHVLKLLARTRPNSPLLPKAAAWLVLHKDQGEWWNSTKQTAMVIYGMIDYLKISGELKPSISVSVRVNGKEVLEKEFKEADVSSLAPHTIKLAANEANEVEVKVSGSGRVYWNAQAKYYSAAEERAVTEGAPMSVTREYFRLAPRENAGVTTYALEPLSGDIRPGDSIAVLVKVAAKDRKYVLIEDPIPAGMELVNNDGNYNLSGKPVWWRYSWAQREMRDDRAAFFRTYFYSDDNEFFYVMKAVNPGKFRVPPTRVQPMYQPQQVATGRAASLEVKQ